MHVIMVVMALRIAGGAQGIFKAPGVVQDLVDQPVIQEGFQGPVQGNAVKIRRHLLFNVAVGKRMVAVKKNLQYLLPAGGRSELKVFQQGFG